MQSFIYTKGIFIAALTIFVLGVAGLGFAMLAKSASTSTSSSTVTSSASSTGTTGSTGGSTSGTTSSGGYTASQVSSHNSSSNCWLIVDSKVYDVTSFIAGGSHRAGNQIILQYCGQDASSAFTVHNGSGYNTLASYLIGNLN